MQDKKQISIHALLAESDARSAWFFATFPISIHALLAESDAARFALVVLEKLFLSTLSLRRATDKAARMAARVGISIHALLAESDYTVWYLPLLSPISIHALLAESDCPGKGGRQ